MRRFEGTRPTGPIRLALTLGAAVFLLAACGGNGDGDGGGTQGDQAAGGENTEFCGAAIAISINPGPDVDFESASPEEIEEALAGFSQEVDPLLRQALASAPEEIAADVETAVANFREALKSGDESVLQSDENRQAEAAIDDFLIANCDVEGIEVSATEYAFSGVPTSVPAGTVAFALSNDGEELHEMIIFRKNPGVTEPAEELLALPEKEAEEKVTFVTAGFAVPGESDSAFAELEPGDYAMVCFVSVGTTSEEERGEGPPHFTRGMLVEFTVG